MVAPDELGCVNAGGKLIRVGGAMLRSGSSLYQWHVMVGHMMLRSVTSGGQVRELMIGDGVMQEEEDEEWVNSEALGAWHAVAETPTMDERI